MSSDIGFSGDAGEAPQRVCSSLDPSVRLDAEAKAVAMPGPSGRCSLLLLPSLGVVSLPWPLCTTTWEGLPSVCCPDGVSSDPSPWKEKSYISLWIDFYSSLKTCFRLESK